MKENNYQVGQSLDIDDNDDEESIFLLKEFLGKVLALWPWLILSAFIGIALAFFYLKYASPQYKINATVLVQDEKKGSSILAAASALQDLGGLGSKSNADNEVLVIKSRTPMEKTVRALQLFVNYYNNDKIKKKELYSERPITLSFSALPKIMSFPNKPYQVKVDKSTNTFIMVNKLKVYKGNLGDSIKLPEGTALVAKGPAYTSWLSNDLFYVSIGDFDATVENYMSLLIVELANKQSSIINLTLTENFPEKGELILNELINQYLLASLEDKNRIADSTVSFIEERLNIVSSELTGVEKNIENFKTTNKLADISDQTKLLLESSSKNIQSETELQVQLSVVQDLETFLNDNVNDRKTVPSSLLIIDPNFVSLIKAYNELQLNRDRRLMSQTAENPAIQNIDVQLRNLRQNILSSIASIKRGIQTSIAQLSKYNSGFASQISTVPAKERQFLEYSRQQALKQELYIYLMTKREETAVSKASNMATTRIVDVAKSESKPFKPSQTMILLGGFLAGLILPLALSYSRDLLNNKINSLADISNVTKVPILAEIGHNPSTNIFAISRNARTPIAEKFRALRTHLQYLLPSDKENAILFTSCMSGEGKSFLSINLAQTLALANKKVLLMELDLRKPKIRENLGLKKMGFTNYVIGKDNNWKQFIQQSGSEGNFDVLCSGPVPPNPAELLLLPKVKILMQELKEAYDYVIMDTAPVGLVTDGEILAPYANLTLYVVRHNYTLRPSLKILNNMFIKNLLPKMNVLVNDIKYTGKGYGGYNSGYGYYGLDDYASENVEEV